MDPQYAALADDIYREKVYRARRSSPEQKLLVGRELFEFGCELSRAGIREQHPEADEAEVERLLARRLALMRKLEAHQMQQRREENRGA